MITLENFSFQYKQQKPLFENLSLTLVPGHIYGLLGKNGEGKSTLLRSIAGLLFPDRGDINVFGFTPSKRSAEFLQEVFYIPEEPYLPSCSVKNLSRKYGSLYPKFGQEQFNEAILQFKIPETEQIGDLSYGQRKKVSIAFALATNANVLLMDEPTNGLDIPSKMQFRKIILSAFSEDRILIMATHQVRDLENLIDSLIILNNNKIALHASTDDISRLLTLRTCKEMEVEGQVLYAQISPGGYKVVTKNTCDSDSQMDLEFIFNAVIESPQSIKEIFA